MPLSEPAARQLIHTRRIHCEGFRRDDGLWDIDGRLTDVKTYEFENKHRGNVRPGDPVHEMYIRMTLDEAFVIRGMEAHSDKHPFEPCPDIEPAYKSLVGTRLGPGFTKKVVEALGREKGCTHLTKLLNNMLVTAIQTLGPWLARENRLPTSGDRPPPQIDGCHALRSDGEVVKEHYPRWYRGTS